MKTVLHWFRQDLRVTDNTALTEAAARAERIVPVFILDEGAGGKSNLSPRRAFRLRSAAALQQTLARLGYTLLVRKGRPELELPRLCQETGAQAVFCNRRYEPEAQAEEAQVFNALNGLGVGFEAFKDAVIWEEREVLTQQGEPFVVFTPYAKAWRSRKPAPPRRKLARARVPSPEGTGGEGAFDPAALARGGDQSLPAPGEAAAEALCQRFLAGPVLEYKQRRDYPALDGTSHLSAHLNCGTIGIRRLLAGLAEVRAAAPEAGKASCDVFLNELIWREFYVQILANFPHVAKRSFRSRYDALPWSEDAGHFRAWCDGQTGYPIVDAAMRCLNATGWMHNRLRMITAMFLTKDLLIHWQWGERYFMRHLVDGDLAANNGGWQWSAGTGTDAAPYFRIFNPVAQGKRFDLEGAFVRRWVPELAGVAGQIHEPWEAAGGAGAYPNRIVLHEEQRDKCLALYRRGK